jgi:pyruvate formate lyase activating enzyme
LRVGGFVPLSTVDWPGQLSATVFTRGCPWDCLYCHNPHLLSFTPEGEGDAGDHPDWAAILAFLAGRVGLLDGVVFTGGEPTAQTALPGAMAAVRDMGFAVALHSGGPSPAAFEAAFPHAAWVGFDVKAPFARYESITRVPGSGERAFESLRLLVESGVPFEARTTVHGGLLSAKDLDAMADELVAAGVREWALQSFREEGARGGLPCRHDVDLEAVVRRHSDRFNRLTVR